MQLERDNGVFYLKAWYERPKGEVPSTVEKAAVCTLMRGDAPCLCSTLALPRSSAASSGFGSNATAQYVRR